MLTFEERQVEVLNAYNLIFATAYKKCGNREKAMDYTQDIAERLLKGSEERIKAGLIEKIVTHTIINSWRDESNRRRILTEKHEKIEMFNHKEQNIQRDYEAKDKIDAIRQVLNEDQFTVFELLAEGWNGKEISTIMNTPYTRVNDLIKHGRIKASKVMLQYS